MRKKAGEGRPPPEFGIMNPVRGWRVSVPKAADEAMDLVATALAVTEMRLLRDELTEDLPEGALIVMLEGPDRQYGLAIFDANMMGGLIEVSTSGRVQPRPSPVRKATRTDAVICADFLDKLFEIYEATVADLSDAPLLSGYRYATPLLDPRLVEMTLPEAPYRQFTLTIDFGNGAKQGELRIAMPAARRPKAAAGERGDGGFQTALRENVLGVRADLNAVLHRVTLPLRQVASLAVGDVIPLPIEALSGVVLETRGSRKIALARLGQSNGYRALRLRDDIEEDVYATAGGDAEFAPAGPAPAPAGLLDLDGPDPASGFGDMSGPTDFAPDLGAFGEGDEAPSDLTEMGDLPALGELPDIADLSPLGDLPALDAFPEGDLPELPPLG